MKAGSKELAPLFNLKNRTKWNAISANSMSTVVQGCWSIYG
jgi:hypothetical protein